MFIVRHGEGLGKFIRRISRKVLEESLERLQNGLCDV